MLAPLNPQDRPPGPLSHTAQLVSTIDRQNGTNTARSALPRERVRCVPSMFDSLGVKVPCST